MISIIKVSFGARIFGGFSGLTRLGLARKHRTCRRLRLRARSAPLGRSKRPLEPARLHWGAQNGHSNSLGSAKALEIARPGCSKTLHLPTFAKSSPLGSAGPETLHWAGPRMPASLHKETNMLVHGMHGHNDELNRTEVSLHMLYRQWRKLRSSL